MEPVLFSNRRSAALPSRYVQLGIVLFAVFVMWFRCTLKLILPDEGCRGNCRKGSR